MFQILQQHDNFEYNGTDKKKTKIGLWCENSLYSYLQRLKTKTPGPLWVFSEADWHTFLTGYWT